jgi:D-glycero-alpha-D-manno-heptose-7-phosphate kinase
MIIAKTPFRISLAGGSTDLESFLDLYGQGSVISFPCNLYTYITIFDDKLGLNSYDKKYIIAYSKREAINQVDKIKNDIARIILKKYNVAPINATFNSDIFSSNCGLASSSSYTLSFLNAILKFKELNYSEVDLCKEALSIEREFNPLTGQQDIFGCGIGGFKKIDFFKDKNPTFKYLNSDIFDRYDFSLIYTGILRSSTNILKQIDSRKSFSLLNLVQEMEIAIEKNRYKDFISIIKEGWIKKKESNPNIIADKVVKKIDQDLANDKSILAHRLCGAGNGGYFLVIKEKTSKINLNTNSNIINISYDKEGSRSYRF